MSFEEWLNNKFESEETVTTRAELLEWLEREGYAEDELDDLIEEYTDYCNDEDILCDLPEYIGN